MFQSLQGCGLTQTYLSPDLAIRQIPVSLFGLNTQMRRPPDKRLSDLK